MSSGDATALCAWANEARRAGLIEADDDTVVAAVHEALQKATDDHASYVRDRHGRSALTRRLRRFASLADAAATSAAALQDLLLEIGPDGARLDDDLSTAMGYEIDVGSRFAAAGRAGTARGYLVDVDSSIYFALKALRPLRGRRRSIKFFSVYELVGVFVRLSGAMPLFEWDEVLQEDEDEKSPRFARVDCLTRDGDGELSGPLVDFLLNADVLFPFLESGFPGDDDRKNKISLEHTLRDVIGTQAAARPNIEVLCRNAGDAFFEGQLLPAYGSAAFVAGGGRGTLTERADGAWVLELDGEVDDTDGA